MVVGGLSFCIWPRAINYELLKLELVLLHLKRKAVSFKERRQWIPWCNLPKKDVHGRESRRGAATKL